MGRLYLPAELAASAAVGELRMEAFFRGNPRGWTDYQDWARRVL